jgi:murein DD-endopeptidase MepM/ murein hydrolase activator NlpD
VLGACEVSDAGKVDTVRVVDTVIRVETVAVSSAGSIGASPPPTAAPATPGAVGAPSTDTTVSSGDLAYLRGRRLLLPVANVRPADLPNTFDEARAGGARRHDALDIRVARGTPVLSADAGRITKLFTSDAGGLTIYASEPSGRFVYYYAHLDRYDPRVREGMPVSRGDTIGYVGTTGNAPPNTPHLHFAVMKLGDPKRWWDGAAINPYPLLANP